MTEWFADALTGGGLTLTLVGAWITAHAVILRDEDAVKIGVARWSSGDTEKDLKLPMVQNLLKSSRGARRGLLMIVAGTSGQLLPIVCRLIGE